MIKVIVEKIQTDGHFYGYAYDSTRADRLLDIVGLYMVTFTPGFCKVKLDGLFFEKTGRKVDLTKIDNNSLMEQLEKHSSYHGWHLLYELEYGE